MAAIGPTLANRIKNNRSLYKYLKPIAERYAQLQGYRQHGLKYDDLIPEENDTVQKAIGRLTTREKYDRVFRIRVASNASVLHKELPKDQWVRPEEDKRYLTPIITDIEAEKAERAHWDSVKPEN